MSHFSVTAVVPGEEHSDGTGSEEEPMMARDWDRSQCLFCRVTSPDFDANLEHMAKTHSMIIPNQGDLIVELETLVGYLHLVVFGYFECLWCGAQKNSREAVQSHMRDKGHCRFDISDETSEFRDFYQFNNSSHSRDANVDNEDRSDVDERDAEEEYFAASRIGVPTLVQIDNDSIRLPSGKVLMQRSYRAPRPPRSNTERPDRTTLSQSSSVHPRPDGSNPGTSKALSKAETRSLATMNQISSLRTSDQRQLMHLAPHEQRAVLTTQKKQIDKARQTEQWMRTQVERKGNKTLMKHFVPDTPGRANG
ncbi:c2h2 finger domain-containing protein [Xylariaceae sp. FL0255]|nr:c2h2 finger domain-containing protein [Xylariaceae sp. FL0255]